MRRSDLALAARLAASALVLLMLLVVPALLAYALANRLTRRRALGSREGGWGGGALMNLPPPRPRVASAAKLPRRGWAAAGAGSAGGSGRAPRYGGTTPAAAHEVKTHYQGAADASAYAAIYSVKGRKFVKGRLKGDMAGGEIVYRLYPGVYIQFSYEYRSEGDPPHKISMTMFRLKGNGEREALREATVEFRSREFLEQFPEQVRDFFDARPGFHRPPTLDTAKVYGEEGHRRLVELLERGGRHAEGGEGHGRSAPRSGAGRERADYAHVIERVQRGLSEEIELFRKTLEEIKEALETVPERYIYIPKRERVLVRTYEDIVAPGAWGSVDAIAYREEEREYHEKVERPEYKREIREWRERMRPLAERAAALLRLFPVKCRGAGYMRWECSDGTVEDYDWFEFRKGSILGALGVSVDDYQKVVSFVKFVLEGED